MSNKNIDIFINKSTTMRGYMTISDEEKNSILQRHSSFYNGYAVGNVPSEAQPLKVGKDASDPNGITVDNKGNVKTYQNHNINESVVSEEEMMEQGCADTKEGCIRKRKEGWVILNNKKGGVWRKCKSKEHCEEMLQAMHVSEEVNEIEAADMDISDEEAAFAFKSGGPEQFDSSYSDDSYGMDIDSIMDMFGDDMSPAEYDDMEGMMDSDMDGKEKFHDEDDAYEFDSQGGNADVYYEEKERYEGHDHEIKEQAGIKFSEDIVFPDVKGWERPNKRMSNREDYEVIYKKPDSKMYINFRPHAANENIIFLNCMNCDGLIEKLGGKVNNNGSITTIEIKKDELQNKINIFKQWAESLKEEVVEKEMCEQCGSEMVEGECMECGALYEEIDEDLHESFKEERMKINEMFNRFSKFN